MQKETINQAPSGRPKRQPVGFRNRLNLAKKDPNYVYRFVNDTDDRVQMFLDAGYEIVDIGRNTVGDKRMDNQTTVDKSISVGGGTRAYAMRIPKEFYDEDQKAKMQRVDAAEEGIKKPPIDGSYGKVEISRS